MCLLVMASSIKDGRSYDASCILNVGDHSFIRHATYMVYRLADEYSQTFILGRIEKNLIKPKEDMNEVVFKRIVDGLAISDETRLRVIQYARKNWIIS